MQKKTLCTLHIGHGKFYWSPRFGNNFMSLPVRRQMKMLGVFDLASTTPLGFLLVSIEMKVPLPSVKNRMSGCQGSDVRETLHRAILLFCIASSLATTLVQSGSFTWDLKLQQHFCHSWTSCWRWMPQYIQNTAFELFCLNCLLICCLNWVLVSLFHCTPSCSSLSLHHCWPVDRFYRTGHRLCYRSKHLVRGQRSGSRISQTSTDRYGRACSFCRHSHLHLSLILARTRCLDL